jgi:hypothetical protein
VSSADLNRLGAILVLEALKKRETRTGKHKHAAYKRTDKKLLS